MSELRVYSLGQLAIAHGEQSLSVLAANKAQALLVYLAATEREYARQVLAGLLWSDSPEELARASLRKAVSQLRHALGEHVLADRNAISLDSTRPHWTDAIEFERACQRLPDEIASSDSVRSSLRASIHLYRDEFLFGFPETGAALFDEWVGQQREHYRRLALDALQFLAEDALCRNDLEIGIADARRALELDPALEETHRLLMRLYVGSGNRTAALRQYDECVRSLRQELNVLPDEATTSLAQSIRNAGVSRGAVTHPDTSRPEHERVDSNLPGALTLLVGRHSELNSLDLVLSSGQVRLVTLLALGGMGKTRLALAAAERQVAKRRFAHGVYLVELESVHNPDQIINAVAEAIGFALQTGADDKRSPEEQLFDYLCNKEMLLILDSFDHLMDGAGVVSRLLRQAASLSVLITSGERLRLPGEHVLSIGGLDWGESSQPAQDDLPDALRLFVNTAQRVVPGFEPSEHELSVIGRICRAVDGIPLAIELAAGWMEVLTADEIENELNIGADVLNSTQRTVSYRHSSLRSVFDAAWQHLPEQHQMIFAALTVCQNGFTRGEAERIAGGTMHHLSGLVSKSFIQYDRERKRYTCHETLRQYGAEKLAEFPEEEKGARQRHGLFFCDFAHKRGRELLGPQQMPALTSLEQEAENLRVAWQWAVQHREWDLIGRAIDGIGTFYEWMGRVGDGERAFRSAIEGLLIPDQDRHRALLAHACTWLSVFLYSQGRTSDADELLYRAIGLLGHDVTDQPELLEKRAFAYWRMGIQAYYRDDDKARDSFLKSLDLFRQIDHGWGIARSLTGLAQAAADAGDYAASESQFRDALVLLRALGDRRAEAHSLHRLAIMLRNAGKLREAVSLAEQSYQLNLELGNRAGTAWSGQILAECLSSVGESTKADELLEKSEVLAEDLGYSLRLENICQERAIVLSRLGRFEEAYAKAERGLSSARAGGRDLRVAWCQIILSDLDLYVENYDEAGARLREAEMLLGRSSRTHALAVVYAFQAMVAVAQKDPASACRLIVASLVTSARHGDSRVHLGIMALVMFLADQGQVEEALAAYGMLRDKTHAISGLSDSLLRRYIDPLIQELSADEVEAAMSRYRDVDVWDFVACWTDKLETMTT